LISVVVSDVAEEAMGRHDDPRIVIDEWIGYWVTMAFNSRSLAAMGLGFILFRIFDVLKPSWVRRSGELPGGWGVVMDDVLAGIFANVILQIVRCTHWI
jgi:phosphatidylglycerophosphatase A